MQRGVVLWALAKRCNNLNLFKCSAYSNNGSLRLTSELLIKFFNYILPVLQKQCCSNINSLCTFSVLRRARFDGHKTVPALVLVHIPNR